MVPIGIPVKGIAFPGLISAFLLAMTLSPTDSLCGGVN
jgi:hypothetical protein